MLPLEIRHKTNKWFKHIIKPSNLLKTTYPQLDQIGQKVKTLRQTTSNHCHSTLTWSTSPRAVQVLLHRHRLLVRQSGNPHQPGPGNVCCMALPGPTGIPSQVFWLANRCGIPTETMSWSPSATSKMSKPQI